MNPENKHPPAYTGTNELEAVEQLKNYNSHIFENAIRHFKGKTKIIDFGAGIGTFSVLFKSQSPQTNVLSVEIDANNQTYLNSRGLKSSTEIPTTGEKFQAIFTSNVLEHIENDEEYLKRFFSILDHDGKLFVYVPAFNFLWTRMDDDVGHVRRYSLPELKLKCERAGFKIDSIRYADALGFFATALLKIFSRRPITQSGPSNFLLAYDRLIFPISRLIDQATHGKLLGKNIMLKATKQD